MKISIQNSVLSVANKPLLNLGELEFFSGNIYSIQGRSGTGKTSFLKALVNSNNKVFSGLEVKFYRTDEKSMFIPKFGKDLVFIQQSSMLWSHLTALQNCWLPWSSQTGLKNLFKRKDIAKGQSEKWLSKLGINSSTKRRLASALSGGEKQRVLIASALVFDSPLIILDEPTSNLDSSNAKIVAKILENEAKKGKLIIVTTHDEELMCRNNWKHFTTKPVKNKDYSYKLDEK